MPLTAALVFLFLTPDVDSMDNADSLASCLKGINDE
jgi:hypothetical protein